VNSDIVSGPEAEISVPVVHWPRYPYAKWLIGGLMVLWTFALWFMTRAGTHFWGPQFYLLVVPMQRRLQ
jgi:hypothetical protein